MFSVVAVEANTRIVEVMLLEGRSEIQSYLQSLLRKVLHEV